MTHSDHAVEAHGLVKHFKSTKAVDGIDLVVPTGSVLGLLGPNGAGKTTTVRMLATLLRPDAGSARVMGHDVVAEADAVRSIVGLTGQFASVDEDLTGAENIRLVARLYGFSGAQARARTDELLSAFELSEAAGRQVKTYSGGMRRRIDLAASMVISPRVLFLDEPTTGLDPRSRGQVWEIVRLLVADGTTVLLTTQYLDEADQLAHRICVIDHGKVIAEGTPAQLKASVGTGALTVRVVDPADRAAAADLVARVLGTPVELSGDVASLAARVPDDADAARRAAALLPELHTAGIEVAEFSLGQPSLDEVFLALTGQRTDEGQRTDQGQRTDEGQQAEDASPSEEEVA